MAGGVWFILVVSQPAAPDHKISPCRKRGRGKIVRRWTVSKVEVLLGINEGWAILTHPELKEEE